MKTSEMTNEELAERLCGIADVFRHEETTRFDDVREAATRLRLKQQSDNYAAALCKKEGEHKREICDIRRRLKVAEDALVVCTAGMCGECHRQHPGETCVNGCYEMSMAKNALAAICEELCAKK